MKATGLRIMIKENTECTVSLLWVDPKNKTFIIGPSWGKQQNCRKDFRFSNFLLPLRNEK